MKPIQSLAIKFDIETLTRHRKVEKWGKSEPYLWTIFFKIDGGMIHLTPQFRIQGTADFYFTEGSHGNLGLVDSSSAKEVKIPAKIGTWETTLEPIALPFFEQNISGLVGVITALMERNNVSSHGAEAGHQALNRYIERSVNQSLQEFDPAAINIENVNASIHEYLMGRVEDFADGIEKAVEKAIRRKQGLLTNLWSLINRDNLIGYKVWSFMNRDIIDANGSIDFSHRWDEEKHGDWEIKGKISVQEEAVKPTKKPNSKNQTSKKIPKLKKQNSRKH